MSSISNSHDSSSSSSSSNGIGNNDILHKLNFALSDASSEYIQRRKIQMARFFTFSALAIFTTRFIHKQTIIRQYVPTLFQQNHQPPTSYNFTTDAAVAVGAGTLACGTISGMMIFGLAWILDVSSLKEFGYRMKELMGGDVKERELSEMSIDEDVRSLQDGLNDLIEGKYDFDKIE
ncbi:AIM11 [Candida oxycetoniae]|uniref:Altered inheritance of mitochondria protein 11 n=1 Tax=Candida oxycetoniae TaxID=497107 RepID=A0AAI9X019_9ASCO|nr:AIM11 [Candida oxycetoniae]KAI3406475.1 AIM11 [Candida oxycetoniae]